MRLLGKSTKMFKGATLAMVRKTFTIMGRDEASSIHDLSKFFYPAMQASTFLEFKYGHCNRRDGSKEKHTCLYLMWQVNMAGKKSHVYTPRLFLFEIEWFKNGKL